MTTYLTASLRERLDAADDRRCAYCRTTSQNTGQPMSVDHIIPRSQGGSTDFENLCYACRRCNEFKGSQIEAVDPLTEVLTQLYNPRHQHWREHFKWIDQGIHLAGRTAIGRATVVALNMNNEYIVESRRNWVNAGWHPPADE